MQKDIRNYEVQSWKWEVKAQETRHKEQGKSKKQDTRHKEQEKDKAQEKTQNPKNKLR